MWLTHCSVYSCWDCCLMWLSLAYCGLVIDILPRVGVIDFGSLAVAALKAYWYWGMFTGLQLSPNYLWVAVQVIWPRNFPSESEVGVRVSSSLSTFVQLSCFNWLNCWDKPSCLWVAVYFGAVEPLTTDSLTAISHFHIHILLLQLYFYTYSGWQSITCFSFDSYLHIHGGHRMLLIRPRLFQ